MYANFDGTNSTNPARTKWCSPSNMSASFPDL